MRTVCLLIATLTACGAPRGPQRAGPQPSQPVAQFPGIARVEVAIRGEPPDLASLLPETSPVRVAEWTVESEPAPGDPPYAAEDDPFEALLDGIATERGVELVRSASLRCAARELARFYARHEGMPTEWHSEFLLAACGSSAVSVVRAGSLGRLSGNVPLEQLATLAADNVRQAIGPAVTSGRMHGLGFAREGNNIAVVLLSAAPAGAFVPWGPPNELGEVHIRGRLATTGDGVLAYVNQGALGVAPCRAEPAVRLPDIDVRCPMAEGDASALVNLEVVTIGRVLAERAAVLMLRRDGVRPTLRSTTGSEPAADDDPRASLLAHLNAARAQAGAPPLALSAPESDVHARAAPFAAAAAVGADLAMSEVVTLGLLAGWAIDTGTIRLAYHLTEVELGTRSPAHWVESVLAHPIGRLLLLRADARQAAIGIVSVEEPSAFAAAVSTYSFFEDVDHQADVARLFARIERERTARGLPPPRRMEGLDVLHAQAARVSQGVEEPAVAFQRALDQESGRRRESLSGVRLEAVDLDNAPLPDALFARRELSLGLTVAHTRARGAAWGQYVVFFVFGR